MIMQRSKPFLSSRTKNAPATALLPIKPSLQDDISFSVWLEQSPDALLITDTAGTIEYVNPAFESLSGYAQGEVRGQSPSILKSAAHDAAFYRTMWLTISSGGAFRGMLVIRRKNGALIHVENTSWPITDSEGRIVHYACQIRDATERLQEIDKLTHAATHDPLTHLPNRTLFHDRLRQALRQAARREEELAVAILDFDRFRDINTRHGHPAGDAVLRRVARRIAGCVREADTVARIGGDEFALILPSAGEHASTHVLEKVRDSNDGTMQHNAYLIGVSLSIGAAIYPRDGTDAQALCKKADRAMYAAKQAGGNCVRFHHASDPNCARAQCPITAT